MAIYDPELFLSSSDRELLRLLAELVLQWDDPRAGSNYTRETAPLSAVESETLLRLLEGFVTSKKFVEGSYLIEKIFGGGSLYDSELRDIYLSWRRRVGKSRAVATIQWENLLGRVGIWTTDRGNPQVWYRANASPMELEYFLKMEARLASAARLHPRVKALILDFVKARLKAIEEIRFGRQKIEAGQVSDGPKSLLSHLQDNRPNPSETPPVSKSKLIGVMTIVLDFSALYTTRDWSVAGFLSTVAGALPPATLD